jgi:hypothetical protein
MSRSEPSSLPSEATSSPSAFAYADLQAQINRAETHMSKAEARYDAAVATKMAAEQIVALLAIYETATKTHHSLVQRMFDRAFLVITFRVSQSGHC